jgi:hypothetical protein
MNCQGLTPLNETSDISNEILQDLQFKFSMTQTFHIPSGLTTIWIVLFD